MQKPKVLTRNPEKFLKSIPINPGKPKKYTYESGESEKVYHKMILCQKSYPSLNYYIPLRIISINTVSMLKSALNVA